MLLSQLFVYLMVCNFKNTVMRNSILVLSALAIFISACDSASVSSSGAEAVDSVRLLQDKANLDETLKRLDVPSQVFSAPGDQLSLIRGKKGTVIFLSPSDLETQDGQAPAANVIVELKELTNQEDLGRANAQTVSNGRLLISGGAYYINMKSDGKQLKLKKGKELKVAFPKISDSAMELFYGQRDSRGQMNWLPAEKQLVSRNGYNIDTRDTSGDRSIMVYNSRTFKLMGYVGNDSTYHRDTATLNVMKKQYRDSIAAERIRAYAQKLFSDSVFKANQKPIVEAYTKLNEKLYDIANIRQLGWVNIDRYAESRTITSITYTINPKDSILVANIYLVYKDFNVTNTYFYYSGTDNGTRGLSGTPIGFKARFIAVSCRNGELLACKMDMTIQENQHTLIRWKKTTREELKGYFDVNNNWGQ